MLPSKTLAYVQEHVTSNAVKKESRSCLVVMPEKHTKFL